MDVEERIALVNKPPLEEIVNFDIVNKPPIDELYHYGILGMKWGIRRYQNPDGTLTEEGKKHYAKQEERRIAKENRQKADILRSPEKLAKNLEKFTDEEITSAYKRFEWQDKLSKYYTNKEGLVKRGKNLADEIISLGDTANNGIKFLNTPAGKLLRAKLGLDTKDIGVFKTPEDQAKEQREYRKAVEEYRQTVMNSQLKEQQVKKGAIDLQMKQWEMIMSEADWNEYKKRGYTKEQMDMINKYNEEHKKEEDD